MTIHKLLLTTALASVTAVAAQADNQNANEPEPERSATVDTPEADVDLDVDVPEATMSADGELTAPRSQQLLGKQPDPVDRTTVDNILEVVEDEERATVSSVDNLKIGEAVSQAGDGGAQHLIYVEVSEDANLAAERIAFEASALSVEQVGGLEYEYTLEQLREAVADRVAGESG